MLAAICARKSMQEACKLRFRITPIILISLISYIGLVEAWSQNDTLMTNDLTPGVALGLGLGVGGGAAVANVSVPLSKRVISVHYITVSEIKFDVGGTGPSGKRLEEIGILYGVLKSSSSSFGCVSLGLSYAAFDHWNSLDRTEKRKR